MNDNKPCRQELMNRINAASFAVDDVKLFLDTHPCDKDAMEYFEKNQEMRKCALREDVYKRQAQDCLVQCLPTRLLNVAKNVWSLTDEIISEEIFIQRKWKKFRYTAMAHIFSTLPISRSGTM